MKQIVTVWLVSLMALAGVQAALASGWFSQSAPKHDIIIEDVLAYQGAIADMPIRVNVGDIRSFSLQIPVYGALTEFPTCVGPSSVIVAAGPSSATCQPRIPAEQDDLSLMVIASVAGRAIPDGTTIICHWPVKAEAIPAHYQLLPCRGSGVTVDAVGRELRFAVGSFDVTYPPDLPEIGGGAP